MAGILIKRERDTANGHTLRKGYVSTQLGDDYLKTKGTASGETKPTNILILDFQPPEPLRK